MERVTGKESFQPRIAFQLFRGHRSTAAVSAKSSPRGDRGFLIGPKFFGPIDAPASGIGIVFRHLDQAHVRATRLALAFKDIDQESSHQRGRHGNQPDKSTP